MAANGACLRTLLISVALILGQLNALHDKPIVHLLPHSNTIRADDGGKLLELINAPSTVGLPKLPLKLDDQGNQWRIQIKNLGPSSVTIVDSGHFRLEINVGQTVQIYSNGTEYIQKH